MIKKRDLVKKSFWQNYWLEVYPRLYFYYQKTRENPEWLAMVILGRFALFRIISNFFTKKTQILLDNSNRSYWESLDTDFVVKSLKKEGYYVGINLPQSILSELLKFANSTSCYGDANLKYKFLYSQKQQVEEKYGEKFYVGKYYNTSRLCPAIDKIVNDPQLLEIAAKYIGADPVFTGSHMWWVFAINQTHYDVSKAVCFYHYHVDDYSSLRLFFYLTDVDFYGGPHVCVRGSHRHKKITQLVSLVKRRDQDIVDYYGSESIDTICGKVGTGFIEDPLCFHKATRPLNKDRLILQIQFARKDYGNNNDVNDLCLHK